MFSCPTETYPVKADDLAGKEEFEMRRYAIIAALALAGVPAGAFAAQPSHPAHPATPASTNASTNATTPSKVMFVLRGTLSKYTAANGPTNGSITITVKSSNFGSPTVLKGSTLTFVVTSKTNVVLHNGKPIADKDNGIVKVRAALHSASTLGGKTAFEVIDQGASA
jgi:hypothetical protein